MQRSRCPPILLQPADPGSLTLSVHGTQRPINCGQWAMRTIVVRLRVWCRGQPPRLETHRYVRHGRRVAPERGGARKGVRGAARPASRITRGTTRRVVDAPSGRGRKLAGHARLGAVAPGQSRRSPSEALASAASFGTAPGRTAAAAGARQRQSPLGCTIVDVRCYMYV